MTDYSKPTVNFRKLGTSLEPLSADLGVTQTPIDRFFVCTVGDAPFIDTSSWRLRITGDAIDAAIELAWADIQALPTTEVTAWLECAGNARSMFTLIDGHEIPAATEHTGWTLGAMGLATWRGPSMASVLHLAGLRDEAAWVSPMGLDVENPEGEAVRMCMPLDRALDADTILAIEMNGEPLPQAHGAPVRLLVPGWVGAYSVKWLGELTVSSKWVPSWRADEYYVDRLPDGSITGPVTRHPVKSNLALDFPAELPAGANRISGYARSGHAPIERVDWCLDDGDWLPADLLSPEGPLAWTCFTVDVDLAPGIHEIRTRASDEAGNTQPDHQPLHPFGVLWNSVIPHRMTAVEPPPG